MRIATWNVNSLKVRLERVLSWLKTSECDVLCIQETKLAQDSFPAKAFEELGFEVAHYGQGQWNGVALVSRLGLSGVKRGLDDYADTEARAISGICGPLRVMSVYVPNGRSLDDPHYQYKLRWMHSLLGSIRGELATYPALVVAGDFNIAPTDRDVWSTAAYEGATHVSVAERDQIIQMANLGMVDLFRHFYQEDKLFSWWDYRGGSFHKRQGLRIDLMFGSQWVVDRTSWALIDRNERKGPQPSDHAPVIVEIAVE